MSVNNNEPVYVPRPEWPDVFRQPSNYCQICGKPMTFSKDPKKAYWEKKWSIHWACKIKVETQLDILSADPYDNNRLTAELIKKRLAEAEDEANR